MRETAVGRWSAGRRCVRLAGFATPPSQGARASGWASQPHPENRTCRPSQRRHVRGAPGFPIAREIHKGSRKGDVPELNGLGLRPLAGWAVLLTAILAGGVSNSYALGPTTIRSTPCGSPSYLDPVTSSDRPKESCKARKRTSYGLLFSSGTAQTVIPHGWPPADWAAGIIDPAGGASIGIGNGNASSHFASFNQCEIQEAAQEQSAHSWTYRICTFAVGLPSRAFKSTSCLGVRGCIESCNLISASN